MLSLLRHCWGLVTGGSRWRAASLALDLCALALLDLAQLVCLHRILDGIGGSISVPVGGLILAALVSAAWLRHVVGRVHRAFAAFTVDYTDEVLGRLGGVDLLAFEQLDRAEAQSTLRIDLEHFRRFAHGFTEVMRGGLVSVVYLGYVAALSPTVAVVLYGWLLAMGVTGSIWARAWRAHGRQLYAARDRFAQLASAIIGGAREIGLHRPRSESLWASVEARGRALRQTELDATRLRAVNQARASLTAPGVLGIIAFVVPSIMVRGDVAAPGLLAVGLLSVRYVHLLIRGVNAALAAAPNHARLQRLLDRLPERAVEAAAGPPMSLHETLALTDVHFTYPARDDGTAFHLGPVELDLRPGRVHFVVGHNGSGKSTLLKGLCGLYPLTGGRVVVDGAPVRTADPAYRSLFAVSFAEPIVHRRLYGLDADAARVDRLLDEMGLADKVRYADGAFDTVELSTGQRKRLSLVLCLLQDRPVLVFDEWAADQDPGFRARFYRALVPRLRAEGKVVVIISHDDQFFDAADDTLVLADGRMVGR